MMKVLLKTRTEELTPQLKRQLVMRTILYCENALGIKKGLKVSIRKQNTGVSVSAYGRYFAANNLLCIYYNNCENVKDIIMTTIHEYTHHLQDLRTYQTWSMLLGYFNNPFEIEAHDNEKFHLSPCWKFIKQKI